MFLEASQNPESIVELKIEFANIKIRGNMPHSGPKRIPIPEDVLGKTNFTKIWPKWRVEKLITLWNDPEKTIMDIVNDLESNIGILTNKIFWIRQKARLISGTTQQANIKKPKNNSRAGWRKCIGHCQRRSYSPDIRQIQMCNKCKQGISSDDMDYTTFDSHGQVMGS